MVVEKVVMRRMVEKIQDAYFLFETTMQRWIHSSLRVCGLIRKLLVEEKQNEGKCETKKCVMVP